MSSLNSNNEMISELQEAEKNEEEKDDENFILENPSVLKKLYPSFLNDAKITKNLLIANEDESIFKRRRPSFIKDENSNFLSDKFLKELVKKPCTLDKNKIISVMTNFIQKSSLIQKFQKDADKDKKIENNELSKMGAENLSYMELKKGQVLFRIGDIGDKFYFILKGKVSILKLKEIKNIEMTYFEYLDYCMNLIIQKENYIFNKVKNRNMKIISIDSENEVIGIYKVFFVKKLKEAIQQDFVPDIKTLIKYLKNYGFKLQDFNIKITNLEKIENNSHLDEDYKREKWKEYLNEKCKPSFSDLMIFEHYKDLFEKEEEEKEEKKSFTCFIYKPFLFLGKGLFFGDFALDSEMNKRNATIRAEENTVLAYMKSSDYINIFAPKRREEKRKEINFLYYNYFFGNINIRSFEKHYFHLFSPHEFSRNSELFNFGSPLEGLILLKEGKVSMEIKASILDLHDLIKYLWEKIEENGFFQDLSVQLKQSLIPTNIEKKIKEYIDKPLFPKLKKYGEKFIEEMNKIKTFQICTFSNKEILGLEEFYLGIPYIMRGTVYGNRITCYKIDKDNFKTILNKERQIVVQYIKSSINKIISLIDRLQSLKINQIKICKAKFEDDILDFTEVNQMNNYNTNQISNEINSINSINGNSKNKGINLKKNSFLNYYKSPINIVATNLNPLIRLINLKKAKINKKLVNSNTNLSNDKISNITNGYYNSSNNSLFKKYSNYFIKKNNQNKTNSNEEKPSDNSLTNKNYDDTNIFSINSNKTINKKNKITFNLSSQRNSSYDNNMANQLNKSPKLKLQPLNELSQRENKKNRISVFKNNPSTTKNSPNCQKFYRNFYFNKRPLEQENYKQLKINSIFFGPELKNTLNIPFNQLLATNIKENKEKNSLKENMDLIINNIKTSKMTNFYKRIKIKGNFPSFKVKNSISKSNYHKNKRKNLSNLSETLSSSIIIQNKSEKESKKISAKLPLIKNKTNI